MTSSWVFWGRSPQVDIWDTEPTSQLRHPNIGLARHPYPWLQLLIIHDLFVEILGEIFILCLPNDPLNHLQPDTTIPRVGLENTRVVHDNH